MFPTTVNQDLQIPCYEANNLSPADSVPLLASNHPDCHAATAFSPVDAQAISLIEDSAHDIFPIIVITREAAAAQQVFHSCQPPQGSLVRSGVTVAPLVGTVVSVSAAATPWQKIDHLEETYEPAPAYNPASPSFSSDTDLPPLQSSTDEDLEIEPTWLTTFASPIMLDPLQPTATLPNSTAAPPSSDTLLLHSVVLGFTVVRRADRCIKSSATRVPTGTCAVKAYRRRRLARRHMREKNALYCRSMPFFTRCVAGHPPIAAYQSMDIVPRTNPMPNL